MIEFRTSIEIPATAQQVFAAIAAPERLARWWGPAGFTNTFTACDFVPGGRWSLVMHGPDGTDYPNENVFLEIEAPRRVVIGHPGFPVFTLEIVLVPTATGTLVEWAQRFEDDELARKIESVVVPANDENIERLREEILR